MTKREMKEKIFDALYNSASDLITAHDPCQFKNGKCKMGRINGCCSQGDVKSKKYPGKWKCRHLNEDTGCTIQTLGCKLYYCWADTHDDSYIRGHLDGLRAVAAQFDIPVNCWETKEKTLSLKGLTDWRGRYLLKSLIS